MAEPEPECKFNIQTLSQARLVSLLVTSYQTPTIMMGVLPGGGLGLSGDLAPTQPIPRMVGLWIFVMGEFWAPGAQAQAGTGAGAYLRNESCLTTGRQVEEQVRSFTTNPQELKDFSIIGRTYSRPLWCKKDESYKIRAYGRG